MWWKYFQFYVDGSSLNKMFDLIRLETVNSIESFD